MSGVNKQIIIGNLGKDPEVKTFENGNKVAEFSLAVNEDYKDRDGKKVEQTEWFNVKVWGKLADVVDNHIKKGDRVYVEGKQKTETWDKDGVTQYRTTTVAQFLTMLGGSKEVNGATIVDHSQSKPENAKIATGTQEDDDLPF